jgi:hypothetical protein
MERRLVQAIPVSIYAEYSNVSALIIRSLPTIRYKKDSYLTKKNTGMKREDAKFYQHEPEKTKRRMFQKIQI